MPDNKTIETILATIGAVLWSIQGVPQVIKSYRTKSTKGLSPYLMLLWAASGLFFCTYVISRDLAIPAIVQPHVSLVLYSVSWAQCLYYDQGLSRVKSTLCCLALLGGGAAFEGASIAGLMAGKRHGTEIPIVVYGYMSTALCIVGLLPQYYTIYQQREVTGLSFTFVFADLVGAVFLIAALFLRPKMDVSGFATYAVTAGMVAGIVILALILNPIAARKRESLPTSTADLTHEKLAKLDVHKHEHEHEHEHKPTSNGTTDSSSEPRHSHEHEDVISHQLDGEDHHVPTLGYASNAAV